MTGSRRVLIVVAVLFAAIFGLPGVGAVREAAAQISVTAADPPAGEQGTLNLNVLIKGKGFKNGAKAKFYKTGTDGPGRRQRQVHPVRELDAVDREHRHRRRRGVEPVRHPGGEHRRPHGQGDRAVQVVTVKGGANPVYEAVFVEFREDDPTWEPKIRGDGFGAYSPVDMGSPGGGGGFRASINLADGRSVLFQFNDPAPRFSPRPMLRGRVRTAPYHGRRLAYLLTTHNAVMPDQTHMTPRGKSTWNAALGRGNVSSNRIRRNQTTYHNLYPLGHATRADGVRDVLI